MLPDRCGDTSATATPPPRAFRVVIVESSACDTSATAATSGVVFGTSTNTPGAVSTSGELILVFSSPGAARAEEPLFPEVEEIRRVHLAPQRRRAMPPRAARVGALRDPRLLRHLLPRRPRPE